MTPCADEPFLFLRNGSNCLPPEAVSRVSVSCPPANKTPEPPSTKPEALIIESGSEPPTSIEYPGVLFIPKNPFELFHTRFEV